MIDVSFEKYMNYLKISGYYFHPAHIFEKEYQQWKTSTKFPKKVILTLFITLRYFDLEAVVDRCSSKKVFLNISQISQ